MKRGILSKISSFFREVKQEVRKVSWPSRKQATKYTLIVVGVSLAVAGFLGGLDFILVTILKEFVF